MFRSLLRSKCFLCTWRAVRQSMKRPRYDACKRRKHVPPPVEDAVSCFCFCFRVLLISSTGPDRFVELNMVNGLSNFADL